VVKKMYHTSFTVGNLERSLTFYRNLLGLEVVTQQEGTAPYLSTMTGFPACHLKVAFLRAPGSDHLFELIEYVNPQGTPAVTPTCNPGSAHIAFLVDDLQACYKRLKEQGVRFRSEPVSITAGRHKGGYALYMLDPDGLTVELMQLP
jgi:catechol 2,3-dioxygenase-like lactoylglutathione lyase family enzyme